MDADAMRDAVSQTSGCETGLIRVGRVLAVEGEFLIHSAQEGEVDLLFVGQPVIVQSGQRAPADRGIAQSDGPQPIHVELLAWSATAIGSVFSLRLDTQLDLLAEVAAEHIGEICKERAHHVPGQFVVTVDAFEPVSRFF